MCLRAYRTERNGGSNHERKVARTKESHLRIEGQRVGSAIVSETAPASA